MEYYKPCVKCHSPGETVCKQCKIYLKKTTVEKIKYLESMVFNAHPESEKIKIQINKLKQRKEPPIKK